MLSKVTKTELFSQMLVFSVGGLDDIEKLSLGYLKNIWHPSKREHQFKKSIAINCVDLL